MKHQRHASVHGRGVEALAKRTTNLILISWSGVLGGGMGEGSEQSLLSGRRVEITTCTERATAHLFVHIYRHRSNICNAVQFSLFASVFSYSARDASLSNSRLQFLENIQHILTSEDYTEDTLRFLTSSVAPHDGFWHQASSSSLDFARNTLPAQFGTDEKRKIN